MIEFRIEALDLFLMAFVQIAAPYVWAQLKAGWGKLSAYNRRQEQERKAAWESDIQELVKVPGNLQNCWHDFSIELKSTLGPLMLLFALLGVAMLQGAAGDGIHPLILVSFWVDASAAIVVAMSLGDRWHVLRQANARYVEQYSE